MRNKTLQLTILAILVLALSACAPTQATPASETPRTLSVSGNARVTAAPDLAYVSVGVHTENAEAAQAVEDNNQQAQAIADALKALGVEEKDIQTMGFNIYPQDEWGPEGERTGTRYLVDNTVYVTVRDVARIGEILQTVVEAGANYIYGIQFDIADKTALIAEARKQAVDNARAQAEELAVAAGVTLGDLQSISYYNNYPVFDSRSVSGYGGGGAAEVAASVPVSPGEITITADVSVSYLIR
jgi:uncharacterized protein